MKPKKCTSALKHSLLLLLFGIALSPATDGIGQDNKPPYLCYLEKGYCISTRSCLHLDAYSPVTKEEAVEFARDIGMLLIDSRLHSTEDNPAVIESAEISKGWRIRIYLPQNQEQWVDISVGRTNGLGSIKSHGNQFQGTPGLGRNILGGSQRTVETVGGNDKTAAALTALDIVRLLGNEMIGLYPTKVSNNENGDWLVTVGSLDCSEAFWEIRLSSIFYLLDYSYTWGF